MSIRLSEIKKKYSVSKDDLKSILSNGVEVATMYWAYVNNDTDEFDRYYEETDFLTSEIVAEIVFNGGSVDIADIEDRGITFPLTLERFLIGIEINEYERPFDSDLQNCDAITSDCILQYAVFGTISCV